MTKKERAIMRRRQNRLEQLCTNNPECFKCGERDWVCLYRHSNSKIECHRCELERLGKRKQPKKSEQSAVNYHACTGCGDDGYYLEDHHLFDFCRVEICVPLCINCHDYICECQRNHPEFTRNAETLLEAIGLLRLNVADLLVLMMIRQKNSAIISEFAHMLVRELPKLGSQFIGIHETSAQK